MRGLTINGNNLSYTYAYDSLERKKNTSCAYVCYVRRAHMNVNSHHMALFIYIDVG